MPTLTERLNIPKPAGNESVTRQNYNDCLDAIDANAAKKTDLDTHQSQGRAAGVHGLSTINTTATITTTWTGSSAPFTQDIAIAGMTAEEDIIVAPVYSADNATAIAQQTAWNCVSKIVPGDGKITVTCFTAKPVTAIPTKIKGV